MPEQSATLVAQVRLVTAIAEININLKYIYSAGG